jgi:hypothetical protein
MLFCQTWVLVEGPTVETPETGEQAEAGSRQQALDQGRLKLPVAKTHHTLRPRGAALLVEGLVVEAHVQNVAARVEPVVVGVD